VSGDTPSGPLGVWLVGARGSVATTTMTGAAALVRGLAPDTGLVTFSPPFADAPLVSLDQVVFGGHDLVETPLSLRAAALVDAGVIPQGLPDAVAESLAAAEVDIRQGIGWHEARTSPRAAIRRAAADLRAFRERHGAERVVVINASSTEPPVQAHPAHDHPDSVLEAIDRDLGILPPSSLYALAAIETGCAFVDFTPSTGARLPGLQALARAHGAPLGGSDGKTGETMLKAALAPAFNSRALRVRSWAGTNLLGGGDGHALADPDRARSKLASKGRSLEQILGYQVEAPVRIEQIRDLGEWKTAWDHITFEGFLGVRMRMQFTWEGCDSALAAPLLLDLARLAGLALDRGEVGPLPDLAFFFKDPMGTDKHALHEQYEMLSAWVTEGISV